ncbi:MAG: caspase family protein [Polyangia bacterium]
MQSRRSRAVLVALALTLVSLVPVIPGSAAPHTPAAPGEQAEVRILSPSDGAQVSGSELVVQATVRLPRGARLLRLLAQIDGRTVAQLRGIRLTPAPAAGAGPGVHLLSVPLPPRDCVLSLQAEYLAQSDRTAAPQSHAAEPVRLRWASPSASAEEQAALQPRLYLLAIGVSEYRRPELQLLFPAKDARDLAAAFAGQQRLLYRSVAARVLTDRQASRDNILDGLEWLQRQTTARDVAILFLAGHGTLDPSTASYYFLPHDADPDAVKRTMLPESEIRNTLSHLPGKAILLLDSCDAASLFGTQRRSLDDVRAFAGELARADNGIVVIASAARQQPTQEANEGSNGVFTKALLEALSGRADRLKTGRITLNMLELYVSERVKELTRGRQTPVVAKPATIPDFPIAVLREVSNEDVDVAR